jgi:hypothetical protein
MPYVDSLLLAFDAADMRIGGNGSWSRALQLALDAMHVPVTVFDLYGLARASHSDAYLWHSHHCRHTRLLLDTRNEDNEQLWLVKLGVTFSPAIGDASLVHFHEFFRVSLCGYRCEANQGHEEVMALMDPARYPRDPLWQGDEPGRLIVMQAPLP